MRVPEKQSWFLKREPWFALLGVLASIGLAVLVYFVVTPSTGPNQAARTLRLASALISGSVVTLISILIVAISTRERLNDSEGRLRKMLPVHLQEELLRSSGLTAVARHEELREPLQRLLNSYEAAVQHHASGHLLDFASEGLTNLAASMEDLPQKRLTLSVSSSFVMDTWRKRMSEAPRGTVAVATSIVDSGWWAQNRDWLNFTCDLMDERDFVWVRIFLFQDEDQKSALNDEMQYQASRGIKVFQLMRDALTGADTALRRFEDTMLIGCSVDRLGSGNFQATVSGGEALGSNLISLDPGGNYALNGLRVSENEEELDSTAAKLTRWLQLSKPVDPGWPRTFFDERYPEIASFKEPEAEEEANFILRQLERVRDTDPRVLDLACAHGRISHRLAARGIPVVGIDSCLPLVEAARKVAEDKRITQAQFEHVDMAEMDGSLGEFTAVVSIFNSFGYLEDEDENAALLRTIRSRLSPGGLFILDVDDDAYFMEHRRGRQEPAPDTSHWNWGTKGTRVECRHSFDGVARRRRSRFFLRTNGSPKELPLVSVRLYGEQELRAMLDRAGFRVDAVYSGFDDRQYERGTSEHMIFAAVAK